MALSCLKAHAMRGTCSRTRCQYRSVIRAQAADSSPGSTGHAPLAEGSTSVNFKLQRHVEYGQSLLLVGNSPELGSWDSKQALELNWGEGDHWTTVASLPAGAKVEYKYIVKRRDGLDWCPGQNKAFVLPSAASLEVIDSWDSPHNNLVVLQPLAAPPPPPTPTPLEAAVEAPLFTVAEEPPALPVPLARNFLGEAQFPPGASNGVPDEAMLAQLGGLLLESSATVVSTVENLHVPELEHDSLEPAPAQLASQSPAPPQAPAPAPAPAQAPQPPSSGFVANNILHGVPMGAIAVPVVQDPITMYEEADKYQVLEVGSAEKSGAAVGALEIRVASASASSAGNGKPLDKMTMSELRSEVKRRGMSPLGNRRELLTRLQNAGIA